MCPHPFDLLPKGSESVKVCPIKCEVDRNRIRLALVGTRKSSDIHLSKSGATFIECHLLNNIAVDPPERTCYQLIGNQRSAKEWHRSPNTPHLGCLIYSDCENSPTGCVKARCPPAFKLNLQVISDKYLEFLRLFPTSLLLKI